MILKNIERAAAFDRTAKAIVSYGLDRSMKKISSKMMIQQSGCWVLPKKIRTDWYSYLSFSGDSLLAHRVSWLLAGMDITPGLCIDHKCENKRCINPFHLQELTLGQNILKGNCLQAKNKRKTHCHAGHPLSGDNLRIERNGTKRTCITCKREGLIARKSKRRAALGLPPVVLNKDKTHCLNGHNFVTNGYTDLKTNKRVCRTCQTLRMREYRKARKQYASG